MIEARAGIINTLTASFFPSDVFMDKGGNIYFGEFTRQRVKKVATAGNISTLAGNGARSFSGDGGPATEASLDQPAGIFVDTAGNIYIADSGNNRIRRVDASGIITTIAGNGKGDFSGDGGLATDAALNVPGDVFLDRQGKVYIADVYNNRVRLMEPQLLSPSGAESEVANSGDATVLGDFDENGQVDYADFFAFADRFGATLEDSTYDPSLDLDANGSIGFEDFFLFADSFEKSVSASMLRSLGTSPPTSTFQTGK